MANPIRRSLNYVGVARAFIVDDLLDEFVKECLNLDIEDFNYKWEDLVEKVPEEELIVLLVCKFKFLQQLAKKRWERIQSNEQAQHGC